MLACSQFLNEAGCLHILQAGSNFIIIWICVCVHLLKVLHQLLREITAVQLLLAVWELFANLICLQFGAQWVYQRLFTKSSSLLPLEMIL